MSMLLHLPLLQATICEDKCLGSIIPDSSRSSSMSVFKKTLGPAANIVLDESSDEPLSPTSPAWREVPAPAEHGMIQSESNNENEPNSSCHNQIREAAEHLPLDNLNSCPQPPSPAAEDGQQDMSMAAIMHTIPDHGPHQGEHILQDKPDPPPRGHVLRELWGAHEGFGWCIGVGKQTCKFGSDGKRARAGPSGMCDLCDPDALHDLYDNCQARLTHLLRELEGNARTKGMQRVRKVLGADIAKDFENRVRRAARRRDPHRERRGPRGPYKKTKTSE